MRKIVTTKMFLVLLIPLFFLIIFFWFNFGSSETWGMNKTVGWAWDLSNFNFIHFPLYLLFLLGYLLLFILKIKTQFTLSAIHLFAIVIPLLIFSNPKYVYITFYSTILSLLIFVANIILSIKNRKKHNAI